jgi:hypothetical protein
MADELLLEQLRAIAREQRISLAEVIRQGTELRVLRHPASRSFITSQRGPASGQVQPDVTPETSHSNLNRGADLRQPHQMRALPTVSA